VGDKAGRGRHVLFPYWAEGAVSRAGAERLRHVSTQCRSRKFRIIVWKLATFAAKKAP